jgi:hypothetical protein
MKLKKKPRPAPSRWLAGIRRDAAGHPPKKREADPSVTFHKSDGTVMRVHLKKLPAEIGVLLLSVGVAGMLLPGPVGTPFFIAGGIALWPSGFAGAARWLERKAPNVYRHGMQQMDRFLSDLENRYPGTVREVNRKDH